MIGTCIFSGLILVLCFMIFKQSRFYRPRRRNTQSIVKKNVVKIAKPNYNAKIDETNEVSSSEKKKYWE